TRGLRGGVATLIDLSLGLLQAATVSTQGDTRRGTRIGGRPSQYSRASPYIQTCARVGRFCSSMKARGITLRNPEKPLRTKTSGSLPVSSTSCPTSQTTIQCSPASCTWLTLAWIAATAPTRIGALLKGLGHQATP